MLPGRLGLETARVPHVDRHGLCTIDFARIWVRNGTLVLSAAAGGHLSPGEYDLPFQRLSCLMMGPGTSITHDALRLLCRHGTGLVAAGEHGVRHYASMPFGPDDARRARRQATLWAEPGRRMGVVYAMYRMRFGEDLPHNADLNALRGLEGGRTKATYRRFAERFGVKWSGRSYDRKRPDDADTINQAINHAAAAVRALANVAVAATGTIPQLGFIHEDSGESFALDIADLVRDEFTLPLAFTVARQQQDRPGQPLERAVRKEAAHLFSKKHLVSLMIDTIKDLIDGDDSGGDS
jgi:CRISPR-associated protein Cas1